LVEPFVCPACREYGCNVIVVRGGDLGVTHPFPYCAAFAKLTPHDFLRAANDFYAARRAN